MFNAEVRRLLIQVIGSWQVWVVTVVLILYVFLINYVARLYNRPRRSHMPILPIPRRRAKKSDAEAPMAPSSDSDDLGLEEAAPGRKK